MVNDNKLGITTGNDFSFQVNISNTQKMANVVLRCTASEFYQGALISGSSINLSNNQNEGHKLIMLKAQCLYL